MAADPLMITVGPEWVKLATHFRTIGGRILCLHCVLLRDIEIQFHYLLAFELLYFCL